MTLQELKDQVARKEGHADWMTCCFRENLTSIELIMEQVAKLYASEACRKQRDICADKARIINDYGDYIIDKDSIKDAPEPLLL